MTRKNDFIQIHWTVSYPASLLNRDENGLAKTVRFGGTERTRVSSQRQKRALRKIKVFGVEDQLAVRSRSLFERKVMNELVANHGATEDQARAIAKIVKSLTVKGEQKNSANLGTEQVVVLSPAEVEYLLARAVQMLSKIREENIEDLSEDNLKAQFELSRPEMKKMQEELATLPVSLDVAAYGRMITSDKAANIDGAIAVAHMFTTHEHLSDPDFFSVGDTLATGPAAATLGDSDLTSGVYYGYTRIDCDKLRENLTYVDGVTPEQMIADYIRGIGSVNPGAKEGSTAPYARPEFILIERGSEQPRSLANAFLDPVPTGKRVMKRSVKALLEHRRGLSGMYGDFEGKAAITTMHLDLVSDEDAPVASLEDAIKMILEG